MSILVFADSTKGNVNKAGFEAINYGKKVAQKVGGDVHVLVIGNCSNVNDLGKYGADKVWHAAGVTSTDAQVAGKVVVDAANKTNATVVVFSQDLSGKAIAPRVAARLDAGLVAGASAYPETGNGFSVRKAVFSGKAFADVVINTEKKVISVSSNTFAVEELGGAGTVETFNVDAAINTPKVTVVTEKIKEGEISLPEAELVVSAGRGLKSPDNWGIIEELAKSLGAATACSRPVSDDGWRPHHEHVGQTGVAVAPNLYIAVGISGAIQHLAGVNKSKVIVVINSDKEAPFFKAADYGIIGDAFDVVPKLTEAIKKFKASAN
jgi:electron transfer flavoprotein alpha subunit